MDYVLIMKRNIDEIDFQFNINKNEVSAIKFVEKNELKHILLSKSLSITPWFSLILKKKIDEIFEMANNYEDIKIHENFPITNFL